MFYKQMTNQFSNRRLVCFLRGVLFALLIPLFISLSTIRTEAAPRLQETTDPVIVVIDPGHGGENEGTIENGFQEKSMVMTTALAMYEELSQFDNVTVYLTRTEDMDLSLKERAEYAAEVKADFLFSIHYNASVDHDLFGAEVWTSAQPPFHAYGYQFGMVWLQNVQEMGLFLRGVKTRLSESGSGEDYYGIIRESVDRGITAVIIEHCHVDEERDVPFCDEQDELISFGKADAHSVARYFGLKSTALQLDYSIEQELAQVSADTPVFQALKDETPPDICMIELLDSDHSTGEMSLSVSAVDYDGMLLYYDYSIDGGQTYSALEPWPGSNALDYTYTDTFTLNLQIPSGIQPDVCVRAYNLFDLASESNVIHSMEAFRYGDIQEVNAAGTLPGTEDTNALEEDSMPREGNYFLPNEDSLDAVAKNHRFLAFLSICFIVIIGILLVVLCYQILRSRRRRQRYLRQLKKDSGNSKNHKK